MRLAITHAENRGSKEVPFGFIYFNDDLRVLYADGKLRDTNWGEVTEQHYRMAKEFLREQGVKGYE